MVPFRLRAKLKSDDPALVTNPGEVPSPKESDGQEQMSKTSNNASSGESLTLQPPYGRNGRKTKSSWSRRDKLQRRISQRQI